MRNSKGFTLLERMIVVSLVMISAAIAIPCLTDSKITTNEASAMASIRAINTAEVSYQPVYSGYANSLANLGGADPCHQVRRNRMPARSNPCRRRKGGLPFCCHGRQSQ